MFVLAAVIVAAVGLLAICAFIFFVGGVRTVGRTTPVVRVPTEIPLNEEFCFMIPRNNRVTIHTAPNDRFTTNVSLSVNKPYLVRVIAGDWYGISWSDVPIGAAGYSRFRYVNPGLSNALFRGDCTTNVDITTVSTVLTALGVRGAAVPYAPPQPVSSFRPGDTDRDGVPENIDACPDVYGLVYNRGCPIQSAPSNLDSDNDGVTNARDDCPNTFGVVQLNGCPGEDPSTMVGDRDGDGLDDEADACPDRFGPDALGGCPGEDPSTMARDTDGDGILDAEDNCPTAMGFVSYMGCPSP